MSLAWRIATRIQLSLGAIFAAIARIFLCLLLDSARFTVKYCLSSVLLRSLLGVLLLAALGGCSVYHHIFHPYRLPTPKPSPEFLAQQKADKKARKAGASTSLFKKKAAPAEAATDVSSPTGGPVVATTAAIPEIRTLPEHTTVHYDKAGLMKNKPKLIRRRVNKQSKPFHPWQSVRHFFKFGLHAKPNYSPDHRPASKLGAQPDATSPDAVPDAAPAPNPKPAPTGKP